MSAYLAASLLVFLGVAHSALGEVAIIGPLLRNRAWEISTPRWATDRVVRFAWHLTTLAWFGLAAALVGVDAGIAFGAVALLSGVIILVVLPAHLAWPFFFAAGLYALDHADALPREVLLGLATAGAVVAAAGAVLHLAWALGWRVGVDHVVPELDGTSEPVRRPGRALTLLVAVAAGVFSWLVMVLAWGDAAAWQWWAVAATGALFIMRVLGEGRYVGVLKKVRGTPFARRDDVLYTPLFAVLAAAAIAAAHLVGMPS